MIFTNKSNLLDVKIAWLIGLAIKFPDRVLEAVKAAEAEACAETQTVERTSPC